MNSKPPADDLPIEPITGYPVKPIILALAAIPFVLAAYLVSELIERIIFGRLPYHLDYWHGILFSVLSAWFAAWAIQKNWRRLIVRVRDAEARLRSAERLELHRDRLALMGTLSAGIVHDIRSPLTTASLIVQLAKEKGAGWLTEKKLETIGEQLDRALGLSERMLAFANPERGIEKKALSVELLFRSLEDMLALDPAAQNVRIEILIHPIDLMVLANRSALEQVLLNLMTNAAQAMKGGGTIWMTAKEEEGNIILEVADNGPGIPDEILRGLFKGFVESDAGHGIGLATAGLIINKLGGTISAGKASQGGALFRIVLPGIPSVRD